MAEENVNIQTQQPTEEEKAATVRLLFSIVFEHIVPWVNGSGDTGLTSRQKLQRNFEKIKAWIDSSPAFFLSKIYDDIAYGHITFNKGLTTNGWTDDAGIEHPALEVKGDSTFSGNLSSPEFISAFFGGLGWAIKKDEVVNAAGEIEYKYTLEIDNATIRNTLRVFDMIISQLLGENANRYFSDMMEVDHFDTETRKVWLKTKNGRLYNPFRVGDIILVQQYQPGNAGIEGGDGYITKTYELRITAVGLGSMDDGENRLDWVEFDNFVTSMENQTAETLIQEFDTFVRCDNDRDPNRKGLLSIMAVGQNTPYMDVVYGMKTDPQHALKSRMGNLEGIITDLFGQLEGFGAYINNLYGVGKFFNYQTGESLHASIQMAREMFQSVYSETTYNIPDEDNFLENGFFQKDLESWVKCNIDGSAAADDEDTNVLGTDDGDGASPLLVNGVPMAISSKTTAQIEDKDGIRVLHLRAMGVSQDFSLIKANGTHEEMRSGIASDTTTIEVADSLYMGVRILPVTAGRLSVKFMRQGGGYTGWERDIDNDINWQLIQAADNTDNPWLWTGNGKLVISYTGECYIRFVALMTDPVANVKEQYRTKFEQTSRRINIQASKQTSDLQEAVAEFNLQFDRITQTVTDNKSAADRAFANLTSDLSSEVSARQSLEQAYHATWVYQNDRLLSLMAAEFNNDGTIKGYADLKVQVNDISTTVTDNKSAADAAIGNINSSLGSLWSYAESIDEEQGASATWISQNKNKWQAVAASFNSDGTVKASGNVELYVNDKISAFTVNADWMNFLFTKEVSWYWGSVADENKRMGLDGSGNLWISGEFRGGNITNNVTIGNSENFRMRIEPSGDNGARLVGLLPSGERALYLGYGSASVTTHGSTISTTSSMLQLTSTVGSQTHVGSYRASMFQINGSSSANILCHAQTEPTINLSNSGDSNGFMIKLDSSGKIKIGGNVSLWNVGQQNGKGNIYVDSNGYVKVQTS